MGNSESTNLRNGLASEQTNSVSHTNLSCQELMNKYATRRSSAPRSAYSDSNILARPETRGLYSSNHYDMFPFSTIGAPSTTQINTNCLGLMDAVISGSGRRKKDSAQNQLDQSNEEEIEQDSSRVLSTDADENDTQQAEDQTIENLEDSQAEKNDEEFLEDLVTIEDNLEQHIAETLENDSTLLQRFNDFRARQNYQFISEDTAKNTLEEFKTSNLDENVAGKITESAEDGDSVNIIVVTKTDPATEIKDQLTPETTKEIDYCTDLKSTSLMSELKSSSSITTSDSNKNSAKKRSKRKKSRTRQTMEKPLDSLEANISKDSRKSTRKKSSKLLSNEIVKKPEKGEEKLAKKSKSQQYLVNTVDLTGKSPVAIITKHGKLLYCDKCQKNSMMKIICKNIPSTLTKVKDQQWILFDKFGNFVRNNTSIAPKPPSKSKEKSGTQLNSQESTMLSKQPTSASVDKKKLTSTREIITKSTEKPLLLEMKPPTNKLSTSKSSPQITDYRNLKALFSQSKLYPTKKPASSSKAQQQSKETAQIKKQRSVSFDVKPDKESKTRKESSSSKPKASSSVDVRRVKSEKMHSTTVDSQSTPKVPKKKPQKVESNDCPPAVDEKIEEDDISFSILKSKFDLYLEKYTKALKTTYEEELRDFQHRFLSRLKRQPITAVSKTHVASSSGRLRTTKNSTVRKSNSSTQAEPEQLSDCSSNPVFSEIPPETLLDKGVSLLPEQTANITDVNQLERIGLLSLAQEEEPVNHQFIFSPVSKNDQQPDQSPQRVDALPPPAERIQETTIIEPTVSTASIIDSTIQIINSLIQMSTAGFGFSDVQQPDLMNDSEHPLQRTASEMMEEELLKQKQVNVQDEVVNSQDIPLEVSCQPGEDVEPVPDIKSLAISINDSGNEDIDEDISSTSSSLSTDDQVHEETNKNDIEKKRIEHNLKQALKQQKRLKKKIRRELERQQIEELHQIQRKRQSLLSLEFKANLERELVQEGCITLDDDELENGNYFVTFNNEHSSTLTPVLKKRSSTPASRPRRRISRVHFSEQLHQTKYFSDTEEQVEREQSEMTMDNDFLHLLSQQDKNDEDINTQQLISETESTTTLTTAKPGEYKSFYYSSMYGNRNSNLIRPQRTATMITTASMLSNSLPSAPVDSSGHQQDEDVGHTSSAHSFLSDRRTVDKYKTSLYSIIDDSGPRVCPDEQISKIPRFIPCLDYIQDLD